MKVNRELMADRRAYGEIMLTYAGTVKTHLDNLIVAFDKYIVANAGVAVVLNKLAFQLQSRVNGVGRLKE